MIVIITLELFMTHKKNTKLLKLLIEAIIVNQNNREDFGQVINILKRTNDWNQFQRYYIKTLKRYEYTGGEEEKAEKIKKASAAFEKMNETMENYESIDILGMDSNLKVPNFSDSINYIMGISNLSADNNLFRQIAAYKFVTGVFKKVNYENNAFGVRLSQGIGDMIGIVRAAGDETHIQELKQIALAHANVCKFLEEILLIYEDSEIDLISTDVSDKLKMVIENSAMSIRNVSQSLTTIVMVDRGLADSEESVVALKNKLMTHLKVYSDYSDALLEIISFLNISESIKRNISTYIGEYKEDVQDYVQEDLKRIDTNVMPKKLEPEDDDETEVIGRSSQSSPLDSDFTMPIPRNAQQDPDEIIKEVNRMIDYVNNHLFD